MNFKAAALYMAMIAVLVVAALGRTQPSPSLPPGVGGENWIAISDSVGIVITATRMGPSKRVRMGPDRFVDIPPTQYASGVVMAKFQGEWRVLEDLTSLGPRVHPLH